MQELTFYDNVMIGDVSTFICKRCGAVVWRCGDHDAWHDYVEGTCKNFSELLEGLAKLLEV